MSCAHHRHRKKCHKHKKTEFSRHKAGQQEPSSGVGWQFQKTQKKKVLVKAEITGLAPNKEYGFHIHQYGDCRENAKNAGSHWNPKGKRHGAPDSKDRHYGDLGNLKSDAKGKAVYEKEVKMCIYKAGGRSVILHADKDDLKSQPSAKPDLI